MKKIFFSIVIIITMSFSAKAQGGNDAFVNSWGMDGRSSTTIDPTLLVLPGWLNGQTDADPLPVGGGLLIFSALGVGYAIAKRNKE